VVRSGGPANQGTTPEPDHSFKMRDWFGARLRTLIMMRREAHFDVLGPLKALRRYAQSLTGHAVDAEDLVHDALMRAYENRATFRTGGNSKVWPLSILHNVYGDRSRTRYAKARRLARAGELVEPHPLPTREQHVRLCQVRQAFIELPKEQRAALHLVAIEGLTSIGAVAAVGVPVGTLMSRIARAGDGLRAIEDKDSMAPTTAARRRHVKVVGGADGHPY
jgi:RNA polymerase sigma factor (sigma-70 family)